MGYGKTAIMSFSVGPAYKVDNLLIGTMPPWGKIS
jgi:hypothetical protein